MFVFFILYSFFYILLLHYLLYFSLFPITIFRMFRIIAMFMSEIPTSDLFLVLEDLFNSQYYKQSVFWEASAPPFLSNVLSFHSCSWRTSEKKSTLMRGFPLILFARLFLLVEARFNVRLHLFVFHSHLIISFSVVHKETVTATYTK